MNASKTPSQRAAAAASSATGADLRIDRERAVALFGAHAQDWPIEIVEETGSTNADLMARVKALPHRSNALPRPIVRVAYLQTAGRGRRGRPWYAEPGNALRFSVACVFPRPLEDLAGLSLAVGVALVDGLRSLPVAGPGQIALKWPNDVLLEGDKLAGILIETAWSTDDASAVVIGIGTNVKGADELAAKVAELSALEPMLQRFGAEGFAPFQPRWNAVHAYAGREVVLLEQGQELARGV